MAEESTVASVEMTQPVIIDLGRQRPRSLRDLKKGEGKLWDEVLDVADEVKEMLGTEADGKVLIPIVMIYQKKSARLNLGNVIFPLLDDEEDDDEEDDEDEE
jgi:hypothetical protein